MSLNRKGAEVIIEEKVRVLGCAWIISKESGFHNCLGKLAHQARITRPLAAQHSSCHERLTKIFDKLSEHLQSSTWWKLFLGGMIYNILLEFPFWFRMTPPCRSQIFPNRQLLLSCFICTRYPLRNRDWDLQEFTLKCF